MSSGVKQVIAVAAVVAIPFVAPVIASSAALAGITSSIGMTATSALVGAGLGAANAAVTGGDVGRGALMGGIGGGISGYNYTPTMPAGYSQDPFSTVTATPAPAAPIYDPTVYSGAPTPAPVYDVNAAGQVVPTTDPTFATPPAGLSNVPTGYSQDPFSTVPEASAPATPRGSEALNLRAQDAASRVDAYNTDASLGAAGQAAIDAAPKTFADALASVPGEIAKKFTDPKALADMTLRAAGSLAGSAIAGSGMSAEEKRLLEAQTNELRQLQQTNKALFDQKLEQAQDLIGESKYFDPEYFGLQRARRAQLAGATAKRAGLRGLGGAQRAAEERRYDLATGRDVGTAFDQGFMTGAGGRIQTTQAGLAAMPSYLTGYGGEYQNIYSQLNAADARRRTGISDFGKLYGSLTGTANAKSVGELEKELAAAKARI